jgi:Arc-like DNA binding domain
MPDDKPSDFVFTNVRWPSDLHRTLSQAAQESCRSLQGEVVFRLKESLKAGGRPRWPQNQRKRRVG